MKVFTNTQKSQLHSKNICRKSFWNGLYEPVFSAKSWENQWFFRMRVMELKKIYKKTFISKCYIVFMSLCIKIQHVKTFSNDSLHTTNMEKVLILAFPLLIWQNHVDGVSVFLRSFKSCQNKYFGEYMLY